jgi:hypothetical protein
VAASILGPFTGKEPFSGA